jgi:hypothetical protein
VGYKSGDRFEPFAVGLELVTPRAVVAADVTTVFRRYSEAALPPPGPIPPRQPQHADSGATGPRDADDVAIRFPAGVWVDPRTRVVRVVEELSNGSTVGVELTTRLPGSSEIFRSRLPGSSEIFRKTAVWSQFGSIY